MYCIYYAWHLQLAYKALKASGLESYKVVSDLQAGQSQSGTRTSSRVSSFLNGITNRSNQVVIMQVLEFCRR